MTKPTIHLNGTSAEDLMNQYLDARNAIIAAIEVVQKSYPNGRDYYPQGSEAIHAAVSEHWARVEPMKKVADELLELAMHCQEFVKE